MYFIGYWDQTFPILNSVQMMKKINRNNKRSLVVSKFLFFLLACSVVLGIHAQNYNRENITLTHFLIRMYNNAPFEGVRIVNDYDNAYLISVVALDTSKYKTEAVLNRVASVKAAAAVSRHLNGSTISQEMIIHTSEKTDKSSDVEITEIIKENSAGYVRSLEQLTNFTRTDGMQVFIFIKEIDRKHT